jgi:hypothetical protein
MIWGRGPVQVSRLTYTLRGPEWGFAVPQGNLAALEEVIRLCSSFWNGLGSLIIPVRSDGTLNQSLDRLLEVREVDQVLVHDAVGERTREALGKRPDRTVRLPGCLQRLLSLDRRHALSLFGSCRICRNKRDFTTGMRFWHPCRGAGWVRVSPNLGRAGV